MQSNILRSMALVAAGAVGAGVLGLFGGRAASRQGGVPQGGQLPFRNAVEQREDMIRELREIKTLLQEQNSLLRKLSATGPLDARKP